jgi:hypothetical protein
MLYYTFAIFVHRPEQGHRKRFHTFPSAWSDGHRVKPSSVIIDFFAETSDVKAIPSGSFTSIDNRYVLGMVSPTTSEDTSSTMSAVAVDHESSSTNTAAEASVDDQGVKYIIGEVAYEDSMFVIHAVKRLENDCKICMLKCPLQANILNVVFIAVIVSEENMYDIAEVEIKKRDLSGNLLYPYLNRIFEVGRFMFVKFSETTPNVQKYIGQSIATELLQTDGTQELSEKVGVLTEQVEILKGLPEPVNGLAVQVDGFTGQIAESQGLSEKVDRLAELMVKLEGKLDKILAKLGG